MSSSTTQSWAAWFLDSYASSVSPVNSDSPYRTHDDSESHSASDNSTASPTHSRSASSLSPASSSSSSTSSAYGPYLRTGRGGAGNFTWQTSLRPAKSMSRLDLEAQSSRTQTDRRHVSLAERRMATARLENIDTQEAMQQGKLSAQYLSVGRGGAGNYATAGASNGSGEMAQRSPSLPVNLSSSALGTKSLSPSNNPYPMAHPGRGGAGNYAAAADVRGRAESEQEQEERLAAEQRRDQVVEVVDGLLQPPPGAWLAPGRRRSKAAFESV